MNADRKTARLATTSLILGILSLGLVVVGLILILRVRLPGGPTDDASRLSLGFLAVFLMLGGAILGIPGWLTGSIARRKNKTGGDDPKINKNAATGQTLSALVVGITIVIFTIAFLAQQNTPLPNPEPPLPSTAVP